MSGKRIIMHLAGARNAFGTTYTHARTIHFLPSISTCIRYLDDKNNVAQHRRSLLINSSTCSTFFGTSKRYKSGKKKKKQLQNDESDDDDDDENNNEEALEDLTGDKNAKVITMQISSMRVDLIVKVGMNMARNKAEVALYNSKIRVNGEKVAKKSMQVKIGDTIDVIRGPSPQNPDFLIVSRIIILSAVVNNDGYRIKFTRDKSLLIENYEDSWTPLDS